MEDCLEGLDAEFSAIKKLKNEGFLSSKRIKEIINPFDEVVSYYIANKVRMLSLQVTQQCNFRCEYCVYSGAYKNRQHSSQKMKLETALKGIDFLIRRSTDAKEISLGFYGGEQLLAFDLIRECILYGYIVSQVGSRQYCELLGFHSFPSFMYSRFLHEHEKIVLFNHFVKNIEMKEDPDIILVGVPGSMMPMNKQQTDKFGIFAYEVSQAVTPDVAVLSTFYDLATDDFLSLVSQTSKYRLGFEIDCFNLANIAFDWRCLNNILLEGASYLTLDHEMVSSIGKKLHSPKTPVYSVMDAREMTDFMIGKLHGYVDTQAV